MTYPIYTLTYAVNGDAHPAVMAGACGLALLVRWLRRRHRSTAHEGHFEVDLDDRSVTVRADARGLAYLYAQAHAYEDRENKRGSGTHVHPTFPLIRDYAGEAWAEKYGHTARNTYMGASPQVIPKRYVPGEDGVPKELADLLLALETQAAMPAPGTLLPGVEKEHGSTGKGLSVTAAEAYALLYWPLVSRPHGIRQGTSKKAVWWNVWATPAVRSPKRCVARVERMLENLKGAGAGSYYIGLPQSAALDYARVAAHAAGGYSRTATSVHVYCWRPAGNQNVLFGHWCLAPDAASLEAWSALRKIGGPPDFRRHIEASCFTTEKNPWRGIRGLLAQRSLAVSKGEEERDIMDDMKRLSGVRTPIDDDFETACTLMRFYMLSRFRDAGDEFGFEQKQQLARQVMMHLRGLRKRVRRWVAANVLPRAHADASQLSSLFALCDTDPERAVDYLIAGTASVLAGRPKDPSTPNTPNTEE